ncbi:MAG: mechanosensitive ion channel domain-containing protein [Gemmatimonadota bacterium]
MAAPSTTLSAAAAGSALQEESLTQTATDLGLGGAVEIAHTVLNFQLFEIGGQSVYVTTIILVGLMILVTWWISHVLQRLVERGFKARGVDDLGTTAITKRLLHYAVLAIGISIAIQQVGINLSALFAAGAIFAVGIGFAMQNIAQNFVSGLILLVERAIKPGDIVEVEGRVVRILKMGIRTTIGKTRDEEEIIIPNASLVQATVKNFTLGDPFFRIRASVGVSYDSDMRKVKESLSRAATSISTRLADREPVIFLTDFADSAVEWQVSIWTANAWTSPLLASELREAIWQAFEEDGITIAFPQVDVHFDSPVEDGLSRLPRAG